MKFWEHELEYYIEEPMDCEESYGYLLKRFLRSIFKGI